MANMSAGCEGVSAPLTFEQIKVLAENATDDALKNIISECTNILQNRQAARHSVPESELNQLFKYVPDFLKNPDSSLDISTYLTPNEPGYNVDEFSKSLRTELESLGLEQGNRRVVKTKWLVNDPKTPPNLKGFKDLKGSVSIDNYKHIKALMELVNKHDDVVGELNGCIINCFRSDSSRHYAHADNEEYIDSACSIATVSLGHSRRFNIYENKHKPTKVLKSFNVEHGSLMIMQPGSQVKTKHKIEKFEGKSENVRYSISFRRLINHNTSETLNENPNENAPEQLPTTLIVGTSIADELDTDRLIGKIRHTNVIKLCKRGGHIKTISNMADTFYNSGKCDIAQVKKIILSIGTNDIRWCRDGVGHLYYPLLNLVRKLKTYYPAANIYIQSLIPIRYMRGRPENPNVVLNVFEFNKLLLKAATAEGCFYFNMLDKFLDSSPARVPVANLYRDQVHLSAEGLGILARSFIKIIRGRHCSVLDI